MRNEQKGNLEVDKVSSLCYNDDSKRKGRKRMYINEALKEVMHIRRVSQTQLADALGVTRQNMNKRMVQKNPQIQTIGEMFALMGYELVLQPVGSHIAAHDQIVIDTKNPPAQDGQGED